MTVLTLGKLIAPAIDRALALTTAGLLGFDTRAVALLLPAIEAGLWAAVAKIAQEPTAHEPGDHEEDAQP